MSRKRNGVGYCDQLAKHTSSAGQGADRLALGLVDPKREEALQFGARVAEHAERGVAGRGQLTCGLKHPVEHALQVKLAQDTSRDVKDAPCRAVHQRSRAEGRACEVLSRLPINGLRRAL